jgi:BMFP domain-containing protein YqiC
MRETFEPPSRALIDLRDERDHLSIQLNLLQNNRLTSPAELDCLKQDLEILERRIADHQRSAPAVAP